MIRRLTRAHFEALSAVLSGVKELREVLKEAEARRRREGRRTVVFIDEIHRFNKAQQDALLAHVESGDIVLIGATTENPSFEVNAALLSRSPGGGAEAARRGAPAGPCWPGRSRTRSAASGGSGVAVAAEAIAFLARASDGDARTALNVLEMAVTTAAPRADGARRVDLDAMRQAFARKALLYDRAGEEHFNIISALHKSIRNSDADAGLYWLARMLEAGEDPLYVARRLVRFASEDVGLADPQALVLAMAAQQAVHFIGMPEGALALAELVVYLAAAPKSNAVYRRVRRGGAGRPHDPGGAGARCGSATPPPRLMKDLGYGEGYRYAHDEAEGVSAMDCLPDALVGRRYYQPTARGAEADLGARLVAARLVRIPPPRDLGGPGDLGPLGQGRSREALGGAAEQESLPVVDPELHAGLELALALDALGDDGRLHLVGEGLERARHLPADVARIDVAHELHVELQVLRVEVRHLLQARVAGPDVVDRDREAHVREVLERLDEERVVLDRVLLADLEHDAVRAQAQPLRAA